MSPAIIVCDLLLPGKQMERDNIEWRCKACLSKPGAVGKGRRSKAKSKQENDDDKDKKEEEEKVIVHMVLVKMFSCVCGFFSPQGHEHIHNLATWRRYAECDDLNAMCKVLCNTPHSHKKTLCLYLCIKTMKITF